MFFEEFEEALSGVVNPGSYVSVGVASELPKFPFISVEGLEDTLTVPISAAQVEKLLKAAHKAPFGKGENTVFDINVRDGWTIPGEKVSFGADGWTQGVDALVGRIKKELGVVYSVKAELHDLLIYSQGGHFKKHRDSEKARGMFGTLVIALPSRHEGGNLTVYQNGEMKAFSSEPHSYSDLTQMSYCAFYSSCEHDVAEVVSGYRIVLTYNLIRTGTGPLPVPPSQRKACSALDLFADKWVSNGDAPSKLCYFLEHEYTTERLGWDSLLGRDKVKADALRECGRYDLLLASMTFTYEGDNGDDEYGSSDREITGTSIDWDIKTDDPNLPRAAQLEIDSSECVQGEDYFDGLQDEDPDGEECEGFTGNEGAPFSMWYFRTAIIAWPKENRLDVLGLEAGLVMLEASIKREEGEMSTEQRRTRDVVVQKCCEFVETGDFDSASVVNLLNLLLSTTFPLDLYVQVLKRISVEDIVRTSAGMSIFSEKMLLAGRKGTLEEAEAAVRVRQVLSDMILDSARKSNEGAIRAWEIVRKLRANVEAADVRVCMDLVEAVMDDLVATLLIQYPVASKSVPLHFGKKQDEMFLRYNGSERLLSVVLDTLIRPNTDAQNPDSRLQTAATNMIENTARFHPFYSIAKALGQYFTKPSPPCEMSAADFAAVRKLAAISAKTLPDEGPLTLVDISSVFIVLNIADVDLESQVAPLLAKCAPLYTVAQAVLHTLKSHPSPHFRRATGSLVNILLKALAQLFDHPRLASIPRESPVSESRLVDLLVDAFETLWMVDNGHTMDHTEDTPPSYCVCLARIINDTPRWDRLLVVLPAVERLASRLSSEARSEDGFHLMVGIVLGALLATVSTPLPPIVDWKIADIKLGCTCPQCGQINCFLLDPMRESIVLYGRDATWTGHVTLNAEGLARQSTFRLGVQRLCTKACKVKGEVKIVKLLPGSTPVALIRSRPEDERRRKEVVDKFAKFEALLSTPVEEKPTEDLATAVLVSGKEAMRSIVLEDEPIAKKQRTT